LPDETTKMILIRLHDASELEKDDVVAARDTERPL
jgi:hypothetical protein